jgi:DNA helicase-4
MTKGSDHTRVYRPAFLARIFSAAKWKLALDPNVSGDIRLGQGGEIDLQCLDIVSISTTKGLLWRTVQIGSRGRTDSLPGLPGKKAAQVCADLHSFINAHLFGLLIDGENGRPQQKSVRVEAAAIWWPGPQSP